MMPGMMPWDGIDVGWAMPYAKAALQFPFSKAAAYYKDDVWLLDDGELAIINPATEKAIQWLVWKFGFGEQVSHPLVAFAIALGGLIAVKLATMKVHQQLNERDHPSRSQQQNGWSRQQPNGGRRDGNQPSSGSQTAQPPERGNINLVPMRPPTEGPSQRVDQPISQPNTLRVSRTVNGRTAASVEEFSSAENPAPVSPSSSPSAFVIADE